MRRWILSLATAVLSWHSIAVVTAIFPQGYENDGNYGRESTGQGQQGQQVEQSPLDVSKTSSSPTVYYGAVPFGHFLYPGDSIHSNRGSFYIAIESHAIAIYGGEAGEGAKLLAATNTSQGITSVLAVNSGLLLVDFEEGNRGHVEPPLSFLSFGPAFGFSEGPLEELELVCLTAMSRIVSVLDLARDALDDAQVPGFDEHPSGIEAVDPSLSHALQSVFRASTYIKLLLESVFEALESYLAVDAGMGSKDGKLRNAVRALVLQSGIESVYGYWVEEIAAIVGSVKKPPPRMMADIMVIINDHRREIFYDPNDNESSSEDESEDADSSFIHRAKSLKVFLAQLKHALKNALGSEKRVPDSTELPPRVESLRTPTSQSPLPPKPEVSKGNSDTIFEKVKNVLPGRKVTSVEQSKRRASDGSEGLARAKTSKPTYDKNPTPNYVPPKVKQSIEVPYGTMKLNVNVDSTSPATIIAQDPLFVTLSPNCSNLGDAISLSLLHFTNALLDIEKIEIPEGMKTVLQKMEGIITKENLQKKTDELDNALFYLSSALRTDASSYYFASDEESIQGRFDYVGRLEAADIQELLNEDLEPAFEKMAALTRLADLSARIDSELQAIQFQYDDYAQLISLKKEPFNQTLNKFIAEFEDFLKDTWISSVQYDAESFGKNRFYDFNKETLAFVPPSLMEFHRMKRLIPQLTRNLTLMSESLQETLKDYHRLQLLDDTTALAGALKMAYHNGETEMVQDFMSFAQTWNDDKKYLAYKVRLFETKRRKWMTESFDLR